MKDWILGIIRAINFRQIFDGATALIGGPLGWLIRIFGGPIVSSVEKTVDNDIEDTIEIDQSDKAAGEKASVDKKQMQDAKTDDEFDKAARDSQS
jgi:hypothetical protein